MVLDCNTTPKVHSQGSGWGFALLTRPKRPRKTRGEATLALSLILVWGPPSFWIARVHVCVDSWKTRNGDTAIDILFCQMERLLSNPNPRVDLRTWSKSQFSVLYKSQAEWHPEYDVSLFRHIGHSITSWVSALDLKTNQDVQDAQSKVRERGGKTKESSKLKDFFGVDL